MSYKEMKLYFFGSMMIKSFNCLSFSVISITFGKMGILNSRQVVLKSCRAFSFCGGLGSLEES